MKFIIFSFLLVILFCSATDSSSEVETLLKLKSSLLSPAASPQLLHDWTATSNHCSFSGVTCNENSYVISLELTNIPLQGTLSPQIGLLQKLTNLTLYRLNLTGPLPLQIANMTTLKFVNLSSNSFSGVFPGEIVKNMTDLETFDVFNNNFTGKLPLEFVKLKRLRTLNLGGNYFYGEIPDDYSEFKSLEILGLQGNSLTGRIPGSLAKLQRLKKLALGYYNMYDGGIPDELGSISSLEILDLGGCNLSGGIPKTFGNLKNLHSLFLQFNRLSGGIPMEISGMESLTDLDLTWNELTGEIPSSFDQLKNLTLLNLFGNKLQGPVPEFIGELPNLEVFQIWDNNFSLHLPTTLGRNGKLKVVDVATNRFTGMIPKDLCNGGRLEMLILMDNQFSGPIPEELGECKSLRKIRLAKNLLNGTIPGGIFNLPLLTFVELNDNFFTGELPAKIHGDSLRSLTLSNNSISGEIPSAIGNLVNLETLSLDMNEFTGEIPGEISNMNQLWVANLSRNALTGEIPGSIGHCVRLISVDLSQNRLKGEIPVEISKLDQLNALNLSGNRLSGEIPGELGLLRGVTVLDLSYNDFTGRRPTNGTLKFIPDRFFAGNSRLCPPNAPLCTSESKHNNHRISNIIIIPITVVIIVSTFMVVIIYYHVRKRNSEKSRNWKLTAFQSVDFKAEDILNSLKEENIIGKSSSGILYRGSMPNGVIVAIQELTNHVSGKEKPRFSTEIKNLGRIKHQNVLGLLGFMSDKDAYMLLYEYMSNGSLGEMLYRSEGTNLQWKTRYRIAVEAAQGLCYLHHDFSPSIIHRDFNSNNIMLDSDFVAHVTNFGLAKFLPDSGTSEWMSSVAGTYGYIAPEYAYTLKVDQKSDVYSFGVVLLELITGRKAVGDFGEGVDIVRWVKNTTSELSQPTDKATAVAVLDPRLSGHSLAGVISMLRIALLCVAYESATRPSMREVVAMLTNQS